MLRELQIKNLDLAALAKEREIGEPKSPELEKKPERIFLPKVRDPIRLKPGPARHLLVRIRDEAHRFAIAYHRNLRQKLASRSVLLEIPGIGENKKRSLLKHFGSLIRVRQADLDQLRSAPGISEADAARILEFLNAQVII